MSFCVFLLKVGNTPESEAAQFRHHSLDGWGRQMPVRHNKWKCGNNWSRERAKTIAIYCGWALYADFKRTVVLLMIGFLYSCNISYLSDCLDCHSEFPNFSWDLLWGRWASRQGHVVALLWGLRHEKRGLRAIVIHMCQQFFSWIGWCCGLIWDSSPRLMMGFQFKFYALWKVHACLPVGKELV